VEIAGTEFVENSLARVLKNQPDVGAFLAVAGFALLDFFQCPYAAAVLAQPYFNETVEHIHVRGTKMTDLHKDREALGKLNLLIRGS